MSDSSQGAIPPELTELLDEFQFLDRDSKAELLIELAERFEGVPEEIATRPYPEEHKVPSCESDAYVFCEALADGTLQFHFAIENPQGISAKAFAQIIRETLSHQPLALVLNVSDEIVLDIFGQGISMGKGLGLRSMIQVVKALATAQTP